MPAEEVWLVIISYDTHVDLLSMHFDPTPQGLVDRELSGVILEIGDDDRIVGIRIPNASRRVRLDHILPVEFQRQSSDDIAP